MWEGPRSNSPTKADARHNLSGGRDRVISDLPAFYPQDRGAVSVSPDRQRILFTSVPSVNSVIQMVDGFF